VGESSSEFRDTLLELIDASPAPGDHPSPDRWLAYHRGELPAEEEASLQEHLARCRDCFDLSAAAAAFAEPDGGTEADRELESDAAWRLLRPRLEPAPQNVVKISDAPRTRSSGFRVPRTLAALFFVAFVGLGTWNVRQQSELAALRAPQPDAPIVEFADSERVSASEERTLSASTGPWMFVFHPAGDLPVYRLTLREEGGKELWSYKLRPDEDFALTIQLREPLPPGRYRFELSDGSGGRADRVLQTQLLRVTGE
jgi:hypothetical protein